MQGESMDAEPARLIIEALKEEKIDLFVTLPEEPTASLTQAVQADDAARSEFERRRHKEPLAPLPPALRPSRSIEEWGFSSKRKGIHNSVGAAL
jgi:hypothetical protein